MIRQYVEVDDNIHICFFYESVHWEIPIYSHWIIDLYIMVFITVFSQFMTLYIIYLTICYQAYE